MNSDQSGRIATAEHRPCDAREDVEGLQDRLADLIRHQEHARSVERKLREQLLAAHQALESRDAAIRDLARAGRELAAMRASLPGRAYAWADSLRKRLAQFAGR